MRCLGRILLNALTALSLILFAATVAAWARSYSTCDQIWRGGYLVQSEFGGLYLVPVARGPDYPIRESFDAGKLGVIEREWGDDVRRFRPTRLIYPLSSSRAWLVIVADWFAAFAFVAMPAYRLARSFRHRAPPGHCRRCGYDLRATPDRCPESGTIPAR
jgi:hypothetical protein